jgi:hypothetical protein
MNTFELTGEALDLAVAQCEGHDVEDPTWWANFRNELCYSTDWAQGGPIIEREKIALRPHEHKLQHWSAEQPLNVLSSFSTGPAPLIAAMRCYVASKQGAIS